MIKRVRLALAALARRRWITLPGYCAALAAATSGVSSVLASSTRKIRRASLGIFQRHEPSIEAPMTAASFQAGIRIAVRGNTARRRRSGYARNGPATSRNCQLAASSGTRADDHQADEDPAQPAQREGRGPPSGQTLAAALTVSRTDS